MSAMNFPERTEDEKLALVIEDRLTSTIQQLKKNGVDVETDPRTEIIRDCFVALGKMIKGEMFFRKMLETVLESLPIEAAMEFLKLTKDIQDEYGVTISLEQYEIKTDDEELMRQIKEMKSSED